MFSLYEIVSYLLLVTLNFIALSDRIHKVINFYFVKSCFVLGHNMWYSFRDTSIGGLIEYTYMYITQTIVVCVNYSMNINYSHLVSFNSDISSCFCLDGMSTGINLCLEVKYYNYIL